MPESPAKVVKVDESHFQKIILLSEKSEKILSEYSEQLKVSSFSSLMGLVSKGVPSEIVKALENYQVCSDYFKLYAKAYIANQGEF